MEGLKPFRGDDHEGIAVDLCDIAALDQGAEFKGSMLIRNDLDGETVQIVGMAAEETEIFNFITGEINHRESPILFSFIVSRVEGNGQANGLCTGNRDNYKSPPGARRTAPGG